jgi:hypothetical protein
LGRQTKGSDTKLDFTHAFEAFVNTFHGVNMASFRNGLVNAGIKDGEFMIWSELMDAKSVFLTANADTVYFFGYADLSKGPMVFEAPPGALGVIDDMWWRWASDFGAPGPDRGLGGKYLLVPPGYTGQLPQGGFFVVYPKTTRVALLVPRLHGEQRPEAGGGGDPQVHRGPPV